MHAQHLIPTRAARKAHEKVLLKVTIRFSTSACITSPELRSNCKIRCPETPTVPT